MKINVVSVRGNPKSPGGGSVSTNTLANALKNMGYEISFAEHPREISNSDIVLHTYIKYLVETQRKCEKRNR